MRKIKGSLYQTTVSLTTTTSFTGYMAKRLQLAIFQYIVQIYKEQTYIDKKDDFLFFSQRVRDEQRFQNVFFCMHVLYLVLILYIVSVYRSDMCRICFALLSIQHFITLLCFFSLCMCFSFHRHVF